MFIPLGNISSCLGRVATAAGNTQILDGVRSTIGESNYMVRVAFSRSEQVIAPKASYVTLTSPCSVPGPDYSLVSNLCFPFSSTMPRCSVSAHVRIPFSPRRANFSGRFSMFAPPATKIFVSELFIVSIPFCRLFVYVCRIFEIVSCPFCFRFRSGCVSNPPLTDLFWIRFCIYRDSCDNSFSIGDVISGIRNFFSLSFHSSNSINFIP
jgi:hypothetical protein